MTLPRLRQPDHYAGLQTDWRSGRQLAGNRGPVHRRDGKEVVVGTLNTLYTAENIQKEEFNPAAFNLGDELLGAVEETGRA